MFEHKSKPLLPWQKFFGRMARSAAVVAGVVAFSLCFGGLGYHYLGGLPWIDAVLNAAMILTGMGPVDPMRSAPAKLFAAAYALYSGVAFLTIVAILMAPLAHRFLHKFHLELGEDDDTREDR